MARMARLDSQAVWAPRLATRRGALDQVLQGVLFAVVWAALWSSFIVGVETTSVAPPGAFPAVAVQQREAPPRG